MKRQLKLFLGYLTVALFASTIISCDDYFNPDSDDELDASDYISSDTEMYTGFLGIMTKVQAIGDKEILLTDTRGELLEITDNASSELIAIYNYDDDLQGNSYANPAGYYEVIIACNDYLEKMVEYREQPGVDDDVWQDLVASAVRVKAWTYKTIGEIYGKAVWFDSSVSKVTDITPENGFEEVDMAALVDKCLTLMDNGVEGVDVSRTISWSDWLDPTGDLSTSEYRKWNWMVPPYEGVYAELCLWKGAVLDAQGADAEYYYKEAADALLSQLTYYADSKYMSSPSDPGSSVYWMPSAATPGHYSSLWNYAQPYPFETVSAIIYDYTKNQTNTLLEHFSNESPNTYSLKPSEVGMNRYTDTSFSPGGSTSDARYSNCFGSNSGVSYIKKFRPVGSSVRTNAWQDDVHIYIYRATQYHTMLAEALNHLNRFTAMNAVLNSGVKTGVYVDGAAEWEGFSRNWTSDAEWGTRKYPSEGLRGCYGLSDRSVKTSNKELGQQETWRYNDLAILDEIMLEFPCEGKTYAAMNRMALRYDDLSIVADRISPKYESSGKSAYVSGKILAGGNYVPYDL